MKKRVLCILACLTLLISLTLPVSASEELPLVVDDAWLMSQEEVLLLEEKARNLSDTYEMDIVILTVDGLEGATPQDYADDYFDYNGYGRGENASGILFLLSMEERDLYVSTCGDAIYALTDYGIEATTDEAIPYLSSGAYYSGFDIWLEALNGYLGAYSDGQVMDGYIEDSSDYYSGNRETIVYYEEDSTPSILLALVIGLAAGGITVLIMRTSMNTKRRQTSAGSYLKAGSYHLQTHQDLFLYSNVTKSARPKETSSGGGSSVHRSSSRRSHGGGGRKF